MNWKLAEQAFQETYHVPETHPQVSISGPRYGARAGAQDSRAFIERELRYLRSISEGMCGMIHSNDVRIAETLRDLRLPDDPDEAMATWYHRLNEAVVEWHRAAGSDIPDLNKLQERGTNSPMSYCFPNYFVLPMFSSAASYRFRPLGPEETLMEIWSLTRSPEGSERSRPTPPEVWDCDDPRWPPIPAQDFANLPKQQKGLHARGFEVMRFSEQAEGHLSNFERVIDGYLAGLSHEQLLGALQLVNVNPVDQPVLSFDLP